MSISARWVFAGQTAVLIFNEAFVFLHQKILIWPGVGSNIRVNNATVKQWFICKCKLEKISPYTVFFFFLLPHIDCSSKHNVTFFFKSIITFHDSNMASDVSKRFVHMYCKTGDRSQKLFFFLFQNIAHLHFDKCMINKHLSDTSKYREYTGYLNLYWCMFRCATSLCQNAIGHLVFLKKTACCQCVP